MRGAVANKSVGVFLLVVLHAALLTMYGGSVALWQLELGCDLYMYGRDTAWGSGCV